MKKVCVASFVLMVISLIGLSSPCRAGFRENFEKIDAFPTDFWACHTLYDPDLKPGIDPVNGHPGHCYVPGGFGHGINTEIYPRDLYVDISKGLQVSCDFKIDKSVTHYTDLSIGLSKGEIVNGENIAYSVFMSLDSNAGSRDIHGDIATSTDAFEQWSESDAYTDGKWHHLMFIIWPDRHVSFYLDSVCVQTTAGKIAPEYTVGIPVLGGFNKRPVYADNFNVSTEIELPMIIDLEMPAEHFYSGDPCQLSCALATVDDSVVSGNLFVMLQVGGSLYFYPDWDHLEIPDLMTTASRWYTPIVVDGKMSLSIIDTFTFPSFPFVLDDLQFIGLVTNPQMSALISNIETVEWSCGGFRP